MIIETLDDWNAINTGCGCCGMPECPVPVMDCESLTVEACGEALPNHPDVPAEDRCLLFKKVGSRWTEERVFSGYEGGLYTTTNGTDSQMLECARVYSYGMTEEDVRGCITSDVATKENTINTVETNNDDGSLFQSIDSYAFGTGTADTWDSYSTTTYVTPPDPADTITDDGPWGYPGCDAFPIGEAATYSEYTFLNSEDISSADGLTTTHKYRVIYSEPVVLDDLTDEIETRISLLSEDVWPESGCQSEVIATEGLADPSDPPVEGEVLAVVCTQVTSATKARVRFQIPSTHTGSWYEITYDIIEEPTGWDDASPTVFRSFVSQDNVLEWTGPGTGAADDPSWFTDWITIAPPTTPGIRRIVNVRYVCYRSTKFGTRPQTIGEGVELPPP